MKLEHIRGNTYMMSVGYTDIAIYRIDSRNAVLIDTGSDPMPKFISHLKAEGIKPVAVIHTHLHIDHIGNDSLINQWAEVPLQIYASREEIDHEHDEGYTVEENVVAGPDRGILTVGSGKGDFPETDFEIVPAPGHSAGHQLVVTPDGVCCLGDALMSKKELRHAKMPYFYDIDDAVRSMKMIAGLDYPVYLAAHKGVIGKSEIRETVEANLKKEEQLQNRLDRLLDSMPEGTPEEKLRILFMQKAGVKNRETLGYHWMHHSAQTRIESRKGKRK